MPVRRPGNAAPRGGARTLAGAVTGRVRSLWFCPVVSGPPFAGAVSAAPGSPLALFAAQQRGPRLGARLGQASILLGPTFHRPRFAAVGTIGDALLGQLRQ